jgi:hypothetical protein
MFLFAPDTTPDFASEGNKLTEMINSLGTALKDSLNADKLIEDLTGAQGMALKLQRSIGGVAINAEGFRDTMLSAWKNTQNLNATFTDVKETVEGVASSMGRMVIFSEKQYEITKQIGDKKVKQYQSELEYMVQFAKATGMAEKDVGTMVGDLSRFGGTMIDNIAYMSDLATSARKSGLDAKTFTTEVGKNMKLASGFGFKAGREGIEKMVKQASMLRTTMDKIGAKEFANNLLDPEKAIEAAASMQMLGGAVGKLADPFQLMHMAQSDMAGLQEEMLKSTKAAFTFNKATGGFDASTEDLYRLREQARITGQNFDELLETGKEMAKMDYLKEKFGLGSMDEDTQNLVAGLSQIGKGGNVIVDIPGYKRLEANSAEQMQALLSSTEVQTKLKEYQEKAGQTEKDIAIGQLTATEKQAADVQAIRNAVILGMDPTKRNDLLNKLNAGSEEMRDIYKDMTEAGQSTVINAAEAGIQGVSDKAKDVKYRYGFDPVDASKQEDFKSGIKNVFNLSGDTATSQNPVVTGGDMFFPSNGGVPQVMTKDTLYKGIVGDQIAIGTNLDKALSQGGGGGMMGGKLDININVSGAVNGDGGNISKIFEDPKVQKQIMDTVLYKLESYKKQQGVIA